ncbi:thiol-disulfide oxidoreductase DCC family protein [soil metagenome]
MLLAAVPGEATLIFDGWCGFCTRSVRLLRGLDRHGRISVEAGQRSGVRDRHGLSDDDIATSAWAILPDGRRFPGAASIAVALAVARQSRLPLLAWRIPGLARLLEVIYRWVAANRRRFRGDTPW